MASPARSRASRYIRENQIWFWLACACLISSVSFFIDPEVQQNSVVGRVFHPFDIAWNVLFFLTGTFKLYGLWCIKPRYEAAGLCFFIGGMLMLVVAGVVVRGLQPGVFINLGLAAAAYFRVRTLVRLSNVEVV